MRKLIVSNAKDISLIHQRAQIIVMSRLVDAKSHMRELDVWMKTQYTLAIVATCVCVSVLAIHFLGIAIFYVALSAVAVTVAMWVKYLMLSYHYAYHREQLRRAQHAMQTLAEHHYTQAQHDAVIKKTA